MIKGCKHYFSMFGMMITSINTSLIKLQTKLKQQTESYIEIQIDMIYKHLQKQKQKNQTYQG